MSHLYPCWFSVYLSCQTLRKGIPASPVTVVDFPVPPLSPIGFRFLHFELGYAHAYLDDVLLRNQLLFHQCLSVALVTVLAPEQLCLKVMLPLQILRGLVVAGDTSLHCFTFNRPMSLYLKQVSCRRHVLGPCHFIWPDKIDYKSASWLFPVRSTCSSILSSSFLTPSAVGVLVFHSLSPG